MYTRPLVILFATVALATGPFAAASASAATPPLPSETGCPVGQALTLDYLGPLGYQVPFQIDAEGNNDGIVCGVPLPDAYRAKFFPTAIVPVIYLFRDNTVTTPQGG